MCLSVWTFFFVLSKDYGYPVCDQLLWFFGHGMSLDQRSGVPPALWDRQTFLSSIIVILFPQDVTLDELQEILPGHQPRYVIYSCRMEHGDGRVSYPMSFIYITPRDAQMSLQIMYAGTKLALQQEADLTRVYEVRELEELTDDWLRGCLSK